MTTLPAKVVSALVVLVALLLTAGSVPAADGQYVQELRGLAAKGDNEARFALALMFEYGDQGVEKDARQATTLLLQAGSSGMPAACLYLGIKYENGVDVGQDLHEAGRWYCCAARQGWAMAQFFLAAMYEKGKWVRQDARLALAWYGLADDQGYPGAREPLSRLQGQLSAAEREQVVKIRSGLEGAGDCSGF